MPIELPHAALANDASQLARCVGQLAERLEAGDQVDLDELCADCPQYREQLEMLLPTLQAVVELEHTLGSPQPPDLPSSPLPSSGEGQGVGVLGDFRILRELGRGGMGVVYEAEQISIGRRVALKVLPFAAMLDRQQLNRFKNEARAAGTLDHPNIVAIHSVGVERGVHYYAMQLIEGESLAQAIARLRKESAVKGQESVEGIAPAPSPLRGWDQPSTGDPKSPERRAVDFAQRPGRGEGGDATVAHRPGVVDDPVPSPRWGGLGRGAEPGTRGAEVSPFPLDTQPVAALSTRPDANPREYFRTIARLGVQAAVALDHAHQNGILHRDVKPANLMVDDAGKLWITDFGLARIEQDAGMTMTGDLLGTLRYMSPEQALAKRIVVDHRSDVYSLGVTLYELLTLEPLFPASDRQELLRQIAFDEPRKPRQINRQIPPELETIVLKAAEKNPADRYATAQELAEDLRRYLEDKPIKAKRQNLLAAARKWSRRHRPLVASAGLSIAALVLVSLGVLTYSNVAITHERNEKSAALNDKAAALQDRTTALASAERNYRRSLEAVDRLLARMGNEQLAEVPQLDQLRMDVLKDTLDFYELFLQENPGDRKVQFELAKTHYRLGMMYHVFLRYTLAAWHRTNAIEILDELCAAEPSNPAYRYHLAVALYQHGWLYGGYGYYRRSIELFEGLVEEFPEEVSYREGLVDAMRSYGDNLTGFFPKIGQSFDAETSRLVKRSLEVARSPGIYKRFLGHAYDLSAALAVCEGRLDDAEADYRQAIRAYGDAIAERPTEGRTRDHHLKSCSRLASLLEQRGDQQQAEDWYRKALGLADGLTRDYPSMRLFRAMEHDIVTRFIAMLRKLDRTDDAIELLQHLPWTAPQDIVWRAALYDAMGRQQLAHADYQEAVDRSQQALQRDPTNVPAYESLFDGLSGLGRRNEALDVARAMSTPDVESLDVRANLFGKFEFEQTSDDKAESVAMRSRLLTYFPKEPLYLGKRAGAYINVPDFDKALVDFDTALDLDPTTSCVWAWRGLAYWSMGKFDKAVADWTEAIRLNPMEAANFSNRASAYRQLRRYDEALVDCDEAIRIDPMSAPAWAARGHLRNDLKQHDRALEDFDEAIRIVPENPWFLSGRGNAYRGLGRYRDATDDYQAALAIDETCWSARINFAWLLATAAEDEFRDGKRAVDLAETAYGAGDFGNFGETKFLRALAAAHAEAGDFETAIAHCQKAIELAKDDKELLEELTKHLANYRAGRPWRIGDEEK